MCDSVCTCFHGVRLCVSVGLCVHETLQCSNLLEGIAEDGRWVREVGIGNGGEMRS